MSNETSRPRRRRARRFLLRAAVALLVVGLGAWLLRDRWLAPLATRLAGRLLDAEVSVAELSTRGLSGLEARGIRARARDGSWRVDLAELEAELSPGRLLYAPGEAARRLRAVGLDARFAGGGDERDPAREPFVWPEHLPALDVTRARVELGTAGQSPVAFEGLSVRSERDGQAVELELERLALAETVWGRDEERLAARLSLDRGRIALARVTLGEREIARDSLVDLAGIGRGEAAFDLELSSLASRVRGTLGGGILELEGAVGSLELATVPRGLLPAWLEDLGGTAGGSFELALETGEAETLDLRVDARVTAPCLGPRSAEELDARLAIQAGVLRVERAFARRGGDGVAFTDVEVPLERLGTGDLVERLRASRGRFAAEIEDAGAWLGLAERDAPARLACAGHVSPAGIALERGELATAGGTLDLRGELAWDPSGAADLDLDGEVAFDDLAPLGELVGAAGFELGDSVWSGSLRGLVRLTGPIAGPTGEVDLRSAGLCIAGFELGDGCLRARADRERIEVLELAASAPYGSLSGTGSLRLARREIEHASLDLDLAHVEELLPAVVDAGAVRLTAELSGSFDEPAGTIELEAEGLRRGARSLDELAASARLSPGWIELARLRARSGEVVLEGAGALSLPFLPAPLERSNGTARVEALRIARGELALELEHPCELRLAPNRIELEPLVLSGDAGRLEARVEVVPERWRIELVGERLSDAGLLLGWLPGAAFADAEGSIAVERDGTELAARVELEVPRLRWRADTDELSLRARFSLEDRQLAVESLALDGPNERVHMQGILPLDPLAWPTPAALPAGPLELTAEADIAALATPPLRALRGRSLAGDLRARLSLRGSWEAPELALELDSEHLAAADLAGSLHARLAFDRALRVSEARASAATGESVELSGEAALACEPRRWLAEGLPEPDEIALDLSASVELADLALFAFLLPSESRLIGRISGEARVGGSAALPLVSGRLELADGELRLPESPVPFAGLHGRLELDAGRLTLGELAGELGRGPFRIRGSVDWSQPGAPGKIELQGERLLLVRGEDLRLRADADLVLEGPLAGSTADARPRLSGTLDLRDGRSTHRLDLLESLRRAGKRRGLSRPRQLPFPSIRFEPLASAELDVRVGGDPIEIEGNLVRARLEPALEISGTGSTPDLTGDLFVSRGAVLVPAGVVEIRSGSISFTRADPLVPRVDLVGAARLAGYDVTVHARGPYDDVDVLLSSSPSLEQSDLSLLLLSGRVPVTGQGPEASRQTVQTLATFLGRDLVTRFMDEEFGSSSGGLFSRAEILQGREVTQSGGQTTEISVRLAPKEEGGKRAIHLRGEKDKYDRTNFGVRFTFRFP
jgi:hypothetical protein